MNRQQRRQAKKAGKATRAEPVYVLKKSELVKAAIKGPGEQAMRKEINNQLLELDKQYTLDMDTMVLWTLHKKYGFGKAKLKQFYLDMFTEHIRMREFYEIDELYPERHSLKEIGVDVEAWFDQLFDAQGNFKNPMEVNI